MHDFDAIECFFFLNFFFILALGVMLYVVIDNSFGGQIARVCCESIQFILETQLVGNAEYKYIHYIEYTLIFSHYLVVVFDWE